jgi:hypothetical protein
MFHQNTSNDTSNKVAAVTAHADLQDVNKSVPKNVLFLKQWSAKAWSSAQSGQGLGLSWVAQIMFGFRACSSDSNQTLYKTFLAFSDHSFFTRKMLFVLALILCS